MSDRRRSSHDCGCGPVLAASPPWSVRGSMCLHGWAAALLVSPKGDTRCYADGDAGFLQLLCRWRRRLLTGGPLSGDVLRQLTPPPHGALPPTHRCAVTDRRRWFGDCASVAKPVAVVANRSATPSPLGEATDRDSRSLTRFPRHSCSAGSSYGSTASSADRAVLYELRGFLAVI